MISEVLICSRTISLYSQCSQVVLPKKHLKVPEFCRSDFGYFWLFFKSAGTYCTTSGGPVRSPEKSGSLINWHIWLIIKTHQTNLMTPWDPQNPLGPPRTPPRPPLDPLTSPLTPLDPWYHLNCLTNNLMTHQLLLFILWVTLDITLDSLGSSNVLLTPPMIPWYP